MTTLGMIARCDRGGLANETWEIWRHLHPARTLIVSGCGRGEDDPYRYDGGDEKDDVRLGMYGHLGEKDFEWLGECDVVLTCETWYDPRGRAIVEAQGARTVGIIHPELRDEPLAQVEYAPTDWELPAGVAVLPHPVATDLLVPTTTHERCVEFFHLRAPAMLDRNGTELAFHDRVTSLARAGKFRLRWQEDGHVRDYWHVIPHDSDALLLPRRYAGLCMPAQEAAALGMPLVCLDAPPLRDLPFALPVGPVSVQQRARMKGGTFDVLTCDPADLAAAMLRLAEDDELYRALRDAALDWAAANSWEALLPRWHEALGLS